MNTIEILNKIRVNGGIVQTDGDDLVVRVSPGVLSEEDKAVLAAEKGALVALLAPQGPRWDDDLSLDAYAQRERIAIRWVETELSDEEGDQILDQAREEWGKIIKTIRANGYEWRVVGAEDGSRSYRRSDYREDEWASLHQQWTDDQTGDPILDRDERKDRRNAGRRYRPLAKSKTGDLPPLEPTPPGPTAESFLLLGQTETKNSSGGEA